MHGIKNTAGLQAMCGEDVNIVLSGHVHAYECSKPVVNYKVCAAAALYSMPLTFILFYFILFYFTSAG
mgnify:CR=1 FL=1